MSTNANHPPESMECRQCGKPARLLAPVRAAANGGGEADYECENGHRSTLFWKPKRREEPAH